MDTLSLTFQNSNWWLVFVGFVAILLLFFSFSNFKQKYNKRIKNILLVIRTFIFFFLIFLILKPVFQWTTEKNIPPKFIFLIDNSQSISKQKNFSSSKIETNLLNLEKQLSSMHIKSEYEKFSYEAISIENFADLDWKDGCTDIALSIEQVARKYASQNICGALLVSDGITTKGEDPALMKDFPEFPLFTTGIGDTTKILDPAVLNISLPETAKAGDTIKVVSEIIPMGINGQKLEILLKENDDIVGKKIVLANDTRFKKELIFNTIARKTGITKYSVVVNKENDSNPFNNTKTGITRIIAENVNIAIISSKAGFEGKILTYTLNRLKNFTVTNFVEFENSWLSINDEKFSQQKWDLAILNGFPSQTTSMQTLSMVRQKITNDIPILFIINNRSSLNKIKKLYNLDINFEIQKNRSQSTLVKISEKGLEHRILNNNFSLKENNRFWENLPPIGYSFNNISLPKSFSPLLQTMDIRQNPVLVVGRNQGQKIAIAFGDDFWRWHFKMRDTRVYDLYKETFTSCVNWLCDPMSSSNLQVLVDKSVYLVGESANISCSVFDVQGKRTDNCDVRGTILLADNPEKSFPLIWNGKKYYSQIPLQNHGEYILNISASRNDIFIGEKEQRFIVINQPIELVDLHQNIETLRAISNKTNAQLINFDEIEKLPQLINPEKRELVLKHEIKLWRWVGSFIFLLILLLGEWIIRKFAGYH